MIIRTAQMEALAQASEGAFQAAMEDHVRSFAPLLARAAGKSGVPQFVRHGIARARRYGFSARDTIRLFLDTSCVLGHGFDTDPQYAWAGEALQEASLHGEDQRADLLGGYLYDYMDAVAGPKNEFAVAALRRTDAACPKQFEELPAMDAQRACDWVRNLYSEKYEYVGRAGLLRLFGEAAQAAQSIAPGLKGAEALTDMLMLVAGHGAFNDPLYPWIGEVFRDPLLATPQARWARLYSRTRTWLSHASAHLGEVRSDA